MRWVFAALLVLLAATIIARASREPDVDEIEYMHTAWLMEQGQTLYTSFFQHHPPYLFATLRTVIGPNLRASFVTARLLSGLFALIAIVAFGAILWRVRPEGAPVAVVLLFASSLLWLRGLTDARAEPYAMAFFWCGAALVLLSRNDVLAGVGAALVVIAALWAPKWPLCTLVVIGFWIAYTRRRVLSAAVAATLVAIAVLILHLLAPLDRVWFFTMEYNLALAAEARVSPELHEAMFKGGVPFLYAPAFLGPVVMLVAFVLVAALVRKNRIVVFLLLLAAAAALEVRFTFPWPALWHHYYLMWGFAAAALAGLVPAALEKVSRSKWIAPVVTVVVLIVGVVHALTSTMWENEGPYWASQRYFARNMRPADTMWIDLGRHPVFARDAHYYWFGFNNLVPLARVLARTPHGSRYLPPGTDLPLCAPPPSLRYVVSPRLLPSLPEQRRCFDRLPVRRAPVPDVYEVVR